MSKEDNGIIADISSANTWTYGNFSMTKEGDKVRLQIINAKMTVPLEKFEKLKDQTSCKTSFNKYTFDIPVPRHKDRGYFSLSITDPNKKVTKSNPIPVNDHCSSQWKSFVDFLLNQKEIFSIYYNAEDKKWQTNISNQAAVRNDLYYKEPKSELPTRSSNIFYTELSHIQKVVTDYLRHSQQLIVTDNFETLQKSLKMELPKDLFFDVEKFYGVSFEERIKRVIHVYGDSPVTVTGMANQKMDVLAQTFYCVNYLPKKLSVKELEDKFMFGDYLNMKKAN